MASSQAEQEAAVPVQVVVPSAEGATAATVVVDGAPSSSAASRSHHPASSLVPMAKQVLETKLHDDGDHDLAIPMAIAHHDDDDNSAVAGGEASSEDGGDRQAIDELVAAVDRIAAQEEARARVVALGAALDINSLAALHVWKKRLLYNIVFLIFFISCDILLVVRDDGEQTASWWGGLCYVLTVLQAVSTLYSYRMYKRIRAVVREQLQALRDALPSVVAGGGHLDLQELTRVARNDLPPEVFEYLDGQRRVGGSRSSGRRGRAARRQHQHQQHQQHHHHHMVFTAQVAVGGARSIGGDGPISAADRRRLQFVRQGGSRRLVRQNATVVDISSDDEHGL